MITLELTAHMGAPVLADEDVHIDGMLMWSRAQELELPQLTRSDPLSALPDLEIPVARRDGIYLASAWILPDDVEPYRHSWTRRRDAVDAERRARNFNPSYGPGRDLLRRGYGVLAGNIRWLIATEDPVVVGRLLSRLMGVGRCRSHGLGEVLRWTVREIDAPLQRVWVDAEGRAARALPVSLLKSWEGPMRRLACAPPYWHPERHVEAVGVGTPVEVA